MNSEQAKRRMGQEHEKALKPDAPVRRQSIDKRNQYGGTGGRMVGNDPATKKIVDHRNPLYPAPGKANIAPRVRPAKTGRAHP